jgi:hypothetical protein
MRPTLVISFFALTIRTLFSLKMNRIQVLLVIVLPLLASCMRDPMPCIQIDKNTFSVGEPIDLWNCNEDRDYDYTWTFGDGESSNKSSVTHSYSRPGTFRIKLEGVDGWRNESTYEIIKVGRYVLKSLFFNSVNDNEVYQSKICDRLYLLDGNTVSASNFGDNCYTNVEYESINPLSDSRISVSYKPELKFVHSFFVNSDSTQPWQIELVRDTLYLDSNITIDPRQQVVFDSLLFVGRHETFNVDLVFPLYIEHE